MKEYILAYREFAEYDCRSRKQGFDPYFSIESLQSLLTSLCSLNHIYVRTDLYCPLPDLIAPKLPVPPLSLKILSYVGSPLILEQFLITLIQYVL